MKANINETPLRQQKLPTRYTRPNGTQWDGYDTLSETIHHEDGWRTINIPTYNATTHRLGALIIDGDNVTYEVVAIPPLTPEEIKAKSIAEGVTIGNILFKTKTDLNDFITQKNELEKLGLTEMGWADKDDIWITLTFAEVQTIFIQAMQEFQLIYKMP